MERAISVGGGNGEMELPLSGNLKQSGGGCFIRSRLSIDETSLYNKRLSTVNLGHEIK